jgi:small subunit ribosomal protein S16
VLTIRLRRAGSKRDPHYRIVVTDSKASRDGRFVEIVGHYHPRRQPVEIVMDVDKAQRWIDQGAQMSDTVRMLYNAAKQGAAADAALAAAAEAEAEEAPAEEAAEVAEAPEEPAS